MAWHGHFPAETTVHLPTHSYGNGTVLCCAVLYGLRMQARWDGERSGVGWRAPSREGEGRVVQSGLVDSVRSCGPPLLILAT